MVAAAVATLKRNAAAIAAMRQDAAAVKNPRALAERNTVSAILPRSIKLKRRPLPISMAVIAKAPWDTLSSQRR